MNKYIQNILSLILIILISILTLEYFNVITIGSLIKDSLSYGTVSLIIIFATASVCSKGSNLNKFLGYLILILTFTGLIIYIISGKLNMVLFSAIGFTALDALINMLYKNV